MTRRAVGLALVLLAALVACSPGGDGASAPVQTPPPAPPGPPPPEGAPLARNTVEVFFPSILGDGLVGEYSEIFETVTPGDRVKQIVTDLISGPTNPEALRSLPAGTRLRQAFVLENGTCYLDFSRDLKEGVGGGSMEELLTVFSIVNSIVHNVPEVRRVALLVEGEPIDSLNGHMDLRRGLRADFSLILQPTIVEAL